MRQLGSTAIRRPSAWAWLVFVVLATLIGCGDARLTSNGLDQSFDSDGGPSRPTNPGDGGFPDFDGGFPNDEPYRPPADELRCILIPSVGGDVFVGVNSSVQLGVYQFSLETGEPMEGEPVTFAILEPDTDARLSSDRVRTDATGLAALRLNAGGTARPLTVRAVSPCANSLDIEVDVMDLPTGDVNVRFNYPFREVLEVAPVRIDLMLADEFNCRGRAPGEVPGGALRTENTGSVLNTVSMTGLDVASTYTLAVTAYGPRGERAAQGCVDSVLVREGRTVEVTVDLFLLPLNPVGDYDVLSWWDFRDAIADSGPVGALIVQILDIFDNPGRGLLNFLFDLIEDFVGGLISGAIRFFLDLTGLDRTIERAINDVINSSPILRDIVTIGRDLRAIIAELEVISKLNIGKLGSDFEVFGVDNWVGLSLYWRLDCEPTSPPDCGRLPIILDTVDLGLLRGEWRGRVIGYDRLDIDRHPIDFQYGRLILYVLEHLVLPRITGRPAPVTLADLMASIINCDGLGDAIAGGPGRCRCALGACICDADIEGFCRTFIDFAFGGLFRSFVNALSFDAVLDIRGSVTLQNLNDDLAVDALTDGQYIGNINVGSSVTPFVADFCGVAEGGDLSECLETRRRTP